MERIWIGAVLMVLAAGPASAQAAKPAPVEAEPRSTTASFGDWVVRCERGSVGDKPVRTCEAAQSMRVQGQANPIAQFAIGRVAAGEPVRATVVVPNNISLPSTVRVAADDKDTQPLELAWRRCPPGGGFADAPTREDTLKHWRGLTEPGRIVFRNGSGQEVAIPISFRGLAQALEALAKS